MAHDYIDIGDSHFRCNDFHIWTLRHFFLCVLDADPPDRLGTDSATQLELKSFIESWRWLGPGVIMEADFNVFANTPARMRVLKSLFERTHDFLDSFGDAIPLSYLEINVNSELAYYTAPQSTEKFRSILASLIDLVPTVDRPFRA